MATKITAQSEWGIGDSDIRITAAHAYGETTQTSGYFQNVEMSITVEEAKKLVVQLQMAIQYVENINQQCKDHDEFMANRESH